MIIIISRTAKPVVHFCYYAFLLFCITGWKHHLPPKSIRYDIIYCVGRYVTIIVDYNTIVTDTT